jgi:outer membrane protein assembly factor BamB
VAAIATLTAACAQVTGLSHFTLDSSPPPDAEPTEETDATTPVGPVEGSATTTDPASPDAAPPPNLCGDTSGILEGAPWPLVYGCPTNAGRSAFHGPATGGTALPPFGTIGNKRGALVGRSGVVFLEESGQGNVYAFDLATGEQKWQAQTLGSGFNPVTALDRDNVLYSSTNYGMFFSIDAATGAVRWKTQLSGVLSPPVISAPGLAFVGSNAYGFYAVDLVAQKQKWHFDVPAIGDTSTAPAVANDVVYAVDSKNQLLFAIAAADGTKKFAVPIAGAPTGSPVVGVDAVYVATSLGITAFDPETGAFKWQKPAVPVVQPALLAYGEVVSATTTGHAFVLDRTTGDELRGADLGGDVQLAPIVASDDLVIYTTSTGTVALANGETPAWSSKLFGTIVLGDGRVIVMPNSQTFGVIGP